jgi:hypothetical protein
MNILTENQRNILSIISKVPFLRDNFYLTGGTALSQFYLRHRYSEDLDFFTNQQGIVRNAVREFESVLIDKGIQFRIIRSFDTFAECLAEFQDEVVKMDFAYDSPYRLQEIVYQPEFGIFSDNFIDIACNKLSALFDRFESKDFVDIYFIHKEKIPLGELIPLAQQKHIGLDEYWLARAMFRARDIVFLPRMIKSVSISELQQFFLQYARRLVEKAPQVE